MGLEERLDSYLLICKSNLRDPDSLLEKYNSEKVLLFRTFFVEGFYENGFNCLFLLRSPKIKSFDTNLRKRFYINKIKITKEIL